MTWSFCRACLVVLLWSAPALAQTEYYIDPDYSGTESGSASQPWNNPDDMWSTVNTELASNPVTVYFSACDTTCANDETWTTMMTVDRTDTSSNLLILDGHTKYNTDDTTPSWSNNTTSLPANDPESLPSTRLFSITVSGTVVRFYTASQTVGEDNITLYGFRTIGTGDGSCVRVWAGDNITLDYIDCTHTTASTGGPGIYFVPILQPANSGCPTPQSALNSCLNSDTFILQNSYIHDNFGEGAYIGACYDQPGQADHSSETVCNNLNDAAQILDNVFLNCGSRGGQGDCIEIKPAWKNLTVRGNVVYKTGSQISDGAEQGVQINGYGLIEDNFIHDHGTNGIVLSEFARCCTGAREGGTTTIRNNVIVDVGNAGSGGDCVSANYDASTNGHFDAVDLYANTCANANNDGFSLEGPASFTYNIRDNVFVDPGTIGLRTSNAAAGSMTHNTYYKAAGGNLVNYGGTIYTAATLSTFDADSLSSDPTLVDTSSPYTVSNFKLQAGSPAIDDGVTIGSFSDDYLGNSRPVGSAWDMGAFEFQVPPPTLEITTTSPMPNGTQNQAYSRTLEGLGGTLPYTWTNNDAGTTLNDDDAQCAGLTVNSAGTVSGTPTQSGDCDWTALLTDDDSSTDTQALTITLVAAGESGSGAGPLIRRVRANPDNRLWWDHSNPANVLRFEAMWNGAPWISVGKAAYASGGYVTSLPFDLGLHTVQLRACNTSGCSVPTEIMEIDVVSPIPTPIDSTTIRIVP